MARRNDHSREELRAMCLDAAQDILTQEGADALSVRRIAQHIGYTHGTLYLIFENLDALRLALNARTLDDLAQALDKASGAASPGVARVHALAMAYLEFALTHMARFRLVFDQHLADGQSLPPEMAQGIRRAYAVLDNALGPPGGTGARLTGAALWSAIHGTTVLTLDRKLVDRNGEPLDPHQVMTRVVESFSGSLA